MRVGMVCCLVALSASAAVAAETRQLPSYFHDSFSIVAAKPLVAYRPPPDETGSVPDGGADVPLPPARPDPESAFTLKVPQGVRITGSTSFVVGGERYTLATLDGLGVNQRCTKDANGRCWRRPMRSLKAAIAGKTLQCRRVDDDGSNRVACEK